MQSTGTILNKINEYETNYRHVLDLPLADPFSNAPRANMQNHAIAVLKTLYWVLDAEMPKYKCTERK